MKNLALLRDFSFSNTIRRVKYFKIKKNMSEENIKREEFRVSGDKIVAKVKELIKEGNARRIIIKSEKGETMLEIPLTIGAIGILIAPVLAAVGALAALVTNCTIVVERK